MRIRILLLAASLIVSGSTMAQKYKDVFPQIVLANEENAFELLNTYLQNDLDNPNANLRIAIIYINRYKAVDVLREQEKALALADRARAYLTKSKVLLTDKEVKRNDEYYVGLIDPGITPSYAQLSSFIDNEVQQLEIFIEKFPALYASFTNSVEKYDEAVKTFANITGTYKSLKELYLLYDGNLANDLAGLKESYDSTKVYFNDYLEQREGFEINAVKQQYSEKPIEIYRMDGLVTQVNFLQEQISLWDYSAWVDTVTLFIEKEINALRDELETNETRIKTALLEVEQTSDPEAFNVVKVDKELVFNLMKYDYQNAIVPLLAYQEFQQQFIIDQYRKTYFDTASIAMERKLAYYNDVMYESKMGDSIIAAFDSRYNIEQLNRHKAFIDKNFGGVNGMKQYMSEQKANNRKVFNEQVKAIKEGVSSIIEVDSIGDMVRSRNARIPLHIIKTPVDSLPLGQIQTRFILQSADESIYIAGAQITDNKLKNHEIAVVKLTPERKPVWVKNFDINIDDLGTRTNHYLGDAKLTAEGIAFLIRSVALDSSKAANTIMHLTESGETKFYSQLETEQIPRELLYIESSNMFVTTYFGNNLRMIPDEKSGLMVIAVNGIGEAIWQYNYALSGDYVQMVNTQNNLLISGNYTSIKNIGGRQISARGGTNAYVISLTLSGELRDIKCFESASPYIIDQFYKVNDKNINLLGKDDQHIIIDSQLRTVYNSLITN